MSAISDSSTTISGPPPVLARISKFSGVFLNAPLLQLPIAAAYHASHLILPDVSAIVGSSNILDISLKPNSSVMSTSSGTPIAAASLRLVLHKIVEDILYAPVLWAKSVEGLLSRVGPRDLKVTIIEPNGIAQSLFRKLEQAGVKLIKTVRPPPGDGGSKSDDIAIVGMSGRFPGGQNLDEFWKTLESGQDLHRTVNPPSLGLPRLS